MTHGDPVRWGVLGTGGITRRAVAGARRARGTEIVAIASRDGARARAAAQALGIPIAYGSYGELLTDRSVEAIYVALPNVLHHEWTLKAINHGKHVLCEKPYSRRPADVTEAFGAAEGRGVFLSEGYMWRHSPQVRLLKELLPEIGDLCAVRATFSFVLTDQANVRLRPDLEGGSLMDLGCYCVSAARLVSGEEPQLAYGDAFLGTTGVDVQFSGILRFPSGVVAQFASGFTSSHMSLEAIGTSGSLLLENPWHGMATELRLNGKTLAVEPSDPYMLEFENASAAVQGRATPLLDGADALGQARALDALLNSASAGKPVAV